jgi:2'-5' RNA ligase
MRLFLALRLPDDVLGAFSDWQAAHLRDVRAVPGEHLHVTLAFLGHRPAAELEPILAALRAAAAGVQPDLRLTVERYRETRSLAMIVLADPGGGSTALAQDVQARLEALGVYAREGRPWLPHVTVARFRERPRLRLEPPAVGTFVPSDAAAYLSRLHPGGARYEILETVALGG